MVTQLNRTMENLRAIGREFYTVEFKENRQLQKTIIHTEDNKVATYDANGKLISICMGV